ncbi:putative ankyrin repeat protein RF_0381 [Patella vulgata]|uniref:putative ankyrin repeat protein RF_0381 n=1 Tax=Patella vulgata TaxID=6465 RepID=UPI0024A974CE|nr:putative ankyrin repeat protein RF_0381 [Patella vulgata]
MLLETNGSCVDLSDINGITPLMLAAIQNEIKVIKLLHKHDANVNKQDDRALQMRKKELVDFVYQYGADINKKNNHGRTSLYLAVQNGNLNAVNLLLKMGGRDVNLSDNKGTSPLMLAVQNSKTELIKLLLQYGADINKQNNRGRTSLYLEVQHKNLNAVNLLLKMGGCDVNLSDNNGTSPLMLAVQRGNTEPVEFLLQYGVDINKQNNRGRTALYLAVQNDNLKAVDVLLEMKGCDVNLSDNQGKSPLILALLNCNTKVIERLHQDNADVKRQALMVATILYNIPYMHALLQHGCNIDVDAQDKDGQTALMLAAKLGDYNIVKQLLEAGADVNISSRAMMPPSCMSACRGFLSVLAYLLDHGADVNAVDQNQCTVLHHMVTKPNGCVILHKLIINNSTVDVFLKIEGCNVNLCDNNGKSPLMLASQYGNLELIEFLHKHKVDVNQQDDLGRTSLYLAVENNNLKAVDVLLNMDGCDVNLSDNKGKPPLILAVQNGNTELMKLFHEYGADINQQDKRGRTSLYLAVQNDDLNAVGVLLNINGCGVNLSDNKGKSPLMLAVQNNNTELLELLHQHNADVNKQDDRGRSAVYYCLHQMCRDEEDGIEIMKLLECFGAEFRTQNRGNKLIKHVMKHFYDYFQHLVDSNMVDFDGLDKNESWTE